MQKNLETLNYWLSLLYQGDLETLEKSMQETLYTMESFEYSDVPDMTTDEAIDIAERWRYE